MKAPFMLSLSVIVLTFIFSIASCADNGVSPKWNAPTGPVSTAQWIVKCPKINLMRRQVSGRYDGASSFDNIAATARGQHARRSWYGNAPGGYTTLDSRMLRAMKILASEGYRFTVTSIAGGSHSRTSRHYGGKAFDVGTINGVRVRAGNPYWRKFLRRCRELGATETLGPGDRGHSTHLHAAWPR